jgi:AraC-like DNA-binding protein
VILVDPLSDVFMAMRVKTSFCVRLKFRAPWGFRFDGYEHAHFGVVARGHCWLSLGEGEKAVLLTEGDCWLLPRGDTHTLRDQPGRAVRSYDEVRPRKVSGVLRYGGGGRTTTMIIGNFTFDGQSSKWLTDVLPRLIAFRMDQGRSSAMQTILQILAAESQTESMGSAIVVSRLADILFVQAVRAHAAREKGLEAGWLRAVGDSQMSMALRAMHEGIEKHWTVASLASTAGMSRSGFAARFKQVLGESPLEYLTRWRMHRAAQLLRESDMKVAKVASLVGYESDGAFNKTFKRTIGMAPGAYRRSFLIIA